MARGLVICCPWEAKFPVVFSSRGVRAATSTSCRLGFRRPYMLLLRLSSSEEYNPYTTWAEDSKHNQVLVIMATNRPESLDPKLRRPGFTDRELVIGLPGPDVRIDIFNVSVQSLSCREPCSWILTGEPCLWILNGKYCAGLQFFTNKAPEDNRTSSKRLES
jgi:SpoVK/Ycf46/Vps4 family AAA+-type ATPase